MNSKIIIRDYSSQDWEEVAKLLHEGYESNIDKETLETQYLGKSRNILVAECDNQVVGTFFWEVQSDYVRPHKTLFLTYLVVSSKFRRQGIARKLCKKMEEVCLQKQCDAIELTSANFRSDAHALYKSLGYSVKKTTIFIKEI